MASGVLKNKTRLVRAGAVALMAAGLGGFCTSSVGNNLHSFQRDAISLEMSSLRTKASLTEEYLCHKNAGMKALAEWYKMGVMNESEYNNNIDQLNSKNYIEDYIINHSNDEQLREEYIDLAAEHDKEHNKACGCSFGLFGSFVATVAGAGILKNSYDNDEKEDEMQA
ncbi:MAG: hypothetical protein E7356_03465 [Clostridiales bacterium]|nr:hypothetical protein [Clostridiales bacterium]